MRDAAFSISDDSVRTRHPAEIHCSVASSASVPDACGERVERGKRDAGVGERRGAPLVRAVRGQPPRDRILAVRAAHRGQRGHRLRRAAHRAHLVDRRELRVGQARRAQPPRRRLRRAQALAEHLGAAHHRRCRVVQFVRKPGGQLAERDEFLVAKIVRGELARAIQHRVHERRRDHRTFVDHLRQQRLGDGEALDGLFGHGVVRRHRTARVRHGARDVAGAPLEDLVQARAAVHADDEMPAEQDHERRGRLTLVIDHVAHAVAPQRAMRCQPLVLGNRRAPERAVLRQETHDAWVQGRAHSVRPSAGNGEQSRSPPSPHPPLPPRDGSRRSARRRPRTRRGCSSRT